MSIWERLRAQVAGRNKTIGGEQPHEPGQEFAQADSGAASPTDDADAYPTTPEGETSLAVADENAAPLVADADAAPTVADADAVSAESDEAAAPVTDGEPEAPASDEPVTEPSGPTPVPEPSDLPAAPEGEPTTIEFEPVPESKSAATTLSRFTSVFRRRRKADGDELEFGIASPEPEPRRRGLIPPWVPWAGGAVAAAFLALILVLVFWPGGAAVRVPDLTGLNRAEAAQRVRVLGLTLRVGDTRFSDTVEEGHVLAQSPKKGAIVSEGSIVTVDLSAGSESFPMPDVIGQKLETARQTLRDRGLDVTFVTIPSDGIPGTVVSSVPSANTTVTIGELVRLSVSAGIGSTGTVVPTDLSGLTFVLDPALAPTGSASDVTFDVARRVRALLEAADARVVLTRGVSDTADTATPADRIRRAKESTSTALVGLMVASSGAVGLQVQSLPATGTPAAVHQASDTLASAIVTALRSEHPSTTTTYSVGDTILKDYGGTAVRLRLGSGASNADRLNFNDPSWADSVARAIFNALARTYGRS